MVRKLVELKKKIAIASHRSKEGHIPSAYSILDILWVLYQEILNVDVNDPSNLNRDRFILSKGHASLGLYAILAHRGFFDIDKLDSFASYESFLGGHPDRTKVPGVEASTGSLGHGLPLAVGAALGFKIKKTDNKVFVLIGDGEANEGSIWEAVMLAGHHKLSNLVCIVDHNHSTDRALDVGDLCSKFASFGWRTAEVDGHNHDEILNVLQQTHGLQPLAVVARTIKGYGCKMMENVPAWHHKSPNSEELVQILGELK